MHNESRYEEIVEKLYIIGVYGSSEDSPDFLDFFARQYDFPNLGKHILVWSGTGIIKKWGISC